MVSGEDSSARRRFDAGLGLKPRGDLQLTPAERVAQRTWSTLGRAKELRARFGEETLTDLLVLGKLPHQRARTEASNLRDQ